MFQREKIEEKSKCLDLISQFGKPYHIAYVSEFLQHSNALIRDKTAEVIIKLFKQIRGKKNLYQSLRHCHIPLSWIDRFKIDFGLHESHYLLAIASLNGNGYVRQRAVRELGTIANPNSIPFIIFRLGDWVKEVRTEASAAIRCYFKPEYFEDFLRQLILFDWILRVERIDLKNIYDEIYSYIFSFELDANLCSRINNLEDKTRFQYFKAYAKRFKISSQLAQLIVKDKSYLVREQVVESLENFNTNDQKMFISTLLSDPSSSIRVQALRHTAKFETEFNQQRLVMLSDEAAAVRELARFLLRNTQLDVREIYKSRIKQKVQLEGSILGLSDVGVSDDLPYLEEFINSKKKNIKLACLKAIQKMNPPRAKEYALQFLSHDLRSIRNACIVILRNNSDQDVLNKAREMYATGNCEERKTALKLFNQIGGWSVIGDILIGIRDIDMGLQEISWQFLQIWKLQATSLFTKPEDSEIARAREIYLDTTRANIEMSYPREILWNDLPFFLGIDSVKS